MNKIFYGDIQPNPKESKIWLNVNGQLKTYNQHKQSWRDLPQSNDEELPPQEPKQITFEIEGHWGGLCTALEGMTWEEWCNSEYNVNGFTYDLDETYRAVYKEEEIIETFDSYIVWWTLYYDGESQHRVDPHDKIRANEFYRTYSE